MITPGLTFPFSRTGFTLDSGSSKAVHPKSIRERRIGIMIRYGNRDVGYVGFSLHSH